MTAASSAAPLQRSIVISALCQKRTFKMLLGYD